MLLVLERFQNLPNEQQYLYQLGRRMGIFSTLNDLENKHLCSQVKLFAQQMQSMNKTIDEITEELMQRFI